MMATTIHTTTVRTGNNTANNNRSNLGWHSTPSYQDLHFTFYISIWEAF